MSGVTVLSESRPVARKGHDCGNCGLPIESGQRYVNQRNVYDGRAYTWKSHEVCHELWCELSREWFLEDDDAIDQHEFRLELASRRPSPTPTDQTKERDQ